MEQVKKAAIVLAAGHGKRMHSKVAKQYLLLNGEPVLVHALRAFEMSGMDTIILVTGADEVEFCRKDIVETYGFSSVKQVVPGGKERYDSVWNGLCALKAAGFPEDGIVLIHDGARPLVDGEIIARAVDGACSYSACVAAMPVKDTIKVADADGFSESTPDRSTLWQIQTPQAFRFELIYRAYEKIFAPGADRSHITDDAMVVELMTDTKVKFVEGSYSNIKVTTPEDMVIAEALLYKGEKYKNNPKSKNVGKFHFYTATPERGFHINHKEYVDHGGGGNYSIKKDIFLEVGGVDEYLNYGAALYEETEICLRVKELGYKVFFNYDAHVWHLAADTGGCRVLDINRYIASLVHNRALLISRHLKWYHRPTAYIYLLRLVASYAFTYRNPGLFRLFAKTYKEGYKKGKLTPKYTHYANI